MTMQFQVEASIANAFSDLIQGGKYEDFVLDLMNKSCKIFPNQYRHNDQQSHGECDFVCIETDEKYDVKLAFGTQDGCLLASRNRDVAAWIKHMIEIKTEFNRCFTSHGLKNVENLTLYKTIQKLISKMEPDEHAIFLFPFPIVRDAEGAVHARFATDILSAVFDCLLDNNLVGERNVYAIYPSINHRIVIRDMRDFFREYMDFPELEQFVSYDFKLLNSKP